MYVSSLVDHVPPKYSQKTAKTKRTGTFIYHRRVRGDKLQVCKTMFVNTLGTGEWCVRDWVLKSARVHGMHTSPSSRKQDRNTGADKREKVLIAREFLESLAKLPSHYCRKGSQKLYLETGITSRTHLNSVSRVLRFQRKTPSVQTSFTQGNEDAKHCHALYTNQKRSVQCVSWT